MSSTPEPKFSEPSLVGVHNQDLAKSTIRIVEGASWKRQNVVMLIPSAKMVPMKCAVTWMTIAPNPNQALHRVPLLGMEVGEAYSKAVEFVLSEPTLGACEYILTVEHDNTAPPGGLQRLLALMDAHPEFSCIGGLYWTKGPGGVPQIWGDPKDPIVNYRPQPPDPNGGLVECCGTGMGFNLFRMSMFKDQRLRKPWFKTLASPTEGYGTQDLYFWGDARKWGYRCAVACDVLVGHYDVNTDTVW